MNALLFVLAIAVLGAIVKKAVLSRERGSKSDLGSVSSQWIAEHRLANSHDPER